MPIYEYQCDECGYLFDRLLKMSDPEPSACPECGAADPRRAISQTAFQLKGDGWYVTDYKTKPTGNGSTSTKSSLDGASDSASSPASNDDSGGSTTSASDSSDSAPSKAKDAV